MANRYWVGGTGTWSAINLLNWSGTSGGTGGATVPSTGDTATFDANSGTGTVTLNYNPTIQALGMSAYTGTLAFGTQNISVNSTGTVFTGGTGYTLTGTPVINATNAGAITISAGASSEANSISFNITTSSGIAAIGGSVKNLNFTGYTGALAANTRTIYGNLTLSTGMSLTAGTTTTTFGATSGTQTITSNTKTMDFPVTIASTGATVRLIDALTVGSTRQLGLASGTLDLNDKTATAGNFSSNNSATRSILFGTTGNITLTGASGTLWTTATITNFSLTGTPTINATDTGSGSRTFTQGAGTAAQAVSIYVKAGTGAVNFATTSGVFQNIDLTGSTAIFTLSNSIVLYGNLTITANGGTATGSTTFAGTSGTQTITSNGFSFDNSIVINGVGGTVQLVDALTMGSTKTLTLTNGTFNSFAKSVTVGAFSASSTNTKTLTLTNSTLTVTNGTSATGFVVSNTGTTYNITGSNIVFTTASVAVFFGGASSAVTFPQVTMGGTGQLILGSTSNSVNITTLANTTQPCTISVLSTMPVLTVTNFNLSGTAGNLVTFNSSVAGTARTISKSSGTVNALYLNVKDSTASGGAKWYANSSNDLGNNTGWNIFNNSFLAVF